jgi:hypothetical protein
MIPASELELGRIYQDATGSYALTRLFVKAAAGTDVVIPHNLGRVPKQAYVVSSEGKAIACYSKVVNGAVVKDTKKITLQFSDTNAICTVRME